MIHYFLPRLINNSVTCSIIASTWFHLFFYFSILARSSLSLREMVHCARDETRWPMVSMFRWDDLSLYRKCAFTLTLMSLFLFFSSRAIIIFVLSLSSSSAPWTGKKREKTRQEEHSPHLLDWPPVTCFIHLFRYQFLLSFYHFSRNLSSVIVDQVAFFAEWQDLFTGDSVVFIHRLQ